MLITFCVWIFVFISSYSFGSFILRFFNKLTASKYALNTALVSVIGLVSFTIFLSYCSLFMAMNNIVLQGIVFLGTGISAWYNRNDFFLLFEKLKIVWHEVSILHKIFFIVFTLFMLIKASGQVQSVDSGAYHLPFIKWVEQYPVIKGLANVHSRFGFNYHYHILYAFYGFANIFGTTQHAINGYLYLMGFVYFYGLYYNNRALIFKIAAVIALLYISQINKGMTGFSPDFPVAIIQMMIIFECWQYAVLRQNNELNASDRSFFILMIFWLTFGTITLKLASVSVIFVLTIILFRELFKNKIILSLIIFSVLIFAPYFIRNYIISGYLIYPFYSVDIFNVFWKVPLQHTIEEKIVIKNWALGYSNYYQGGYHYNLALFKQWLHRLPELNKAYLPVIFVIGLCMLLCLFKWGRQLFSSIKRKQLMDAENRTLFGLIIGLLFWFYNAPDPRFGNGIILPFIAIVLARLYVCFCGGKFTNWVAKLFPIAITLSSILSLSGKAISQPELQSNEVNFALLKQPAYPQPDTTSLIIDGQKIYKGSSNQYGKCWECPLPCSYSADKYRFIEPGKITSGFKPDYTE
jgi:hypothetical protein